MSFARALLVLALGVAGATACAAAAEEDTTAAEANLTASSVPDDEPSLVVKNPATLAALEEQGFSFAAQLGLTGASGASGKDLMASPRYAKIVATIERDLAELRSLDPISGVGFDFLHRQFDPRWLASTQSRFELVGVVNRTDRAPIGGCGDFRLLYRFAYTAKQSEGRLPMTLNFIFPQKDDGKGCSTYAKKWLDARSGTAQALLAGPLKDHAPLGDIDINVQAVRWPSNARRTLGGQSEYLLRTFTAEGETTVENTPELQMDEARRAELATWIKENLAGIDDGTAVLPAKFLTKRAISVGPLGLARLANKPFTQLFPNAKELFADVPFASTTQIKSPAALMRRLDSMTCQGCHQSRSIAGFHLLGEERNVDERLNAIAVARSPHFMEELPWRRETLESLAVQQRMTPRPFAERADGVGRYGAHCGLGDPGFATWTCNEGLECLDHHGDVVGMCSPTDAPVGDACEVGRVTQTPNPHADTVPPPEKRTLKCNAEGIDSRCNPVGQGFPDGLCRTDCEAADTGKIVGATICGGIPSASGLTKCLTVDRLPFKHCLATTNNPTFLRTCTETNPCRDDYACMRVDGGPAATGACMPPYFAFQARVDGHIFDFE